MVRIVREPNPTTPQLLRVSTSSATSSRGPRGSGSGSPSGGGSPSRHLFVKTKVASTPRAVLSSPNSNSKSGTGTAKKRAVLGEREENIMSTGAPRPSLTPRAKHKSTTSAAASTNELTGLSRFIATSPRDSLPPPPPPRSRFHVPSSSPMPSYDVSFRTKHGNTPYAPRPSMPLHFNEDDTMLLDMRPPEMALSSPTFEMTDDSDAESRADGAGTRIRGGLMTPANSQEVAPGSPQRTQTIKRPTQTANLVRNSLSRLPTPPSSQSDSHTALLPPTPQAGSSRASRIRARPSPTPPRRVSPEPTMTADHGDITAEWDTPLKLGDYVSPNPRKKKSPRLSQPGGTPTRQRSASVQRDRVEVVLPLRRSATPANTSTDAPDTVKAKGKGRASASQTPSAGLSQSTSARRSSGGSRRSSGGSASSKKAATPAPSKAKAKAVPSSAPAGRRRTSAAPGRATVRPSRTVTPSDAAKTRRASVPPSLKTPATKTRARKSVAMTPRDLALSGRKLGMLPRPIHGSPGDDPLLLKGGDDMPRRSVGTGARDGAGLGLTGMTRSMPSSASQNRSKSATDVPAPSPFVFQGGDDLTLIPTSGSGGMDYLDHPAWSDDGSDAEGGVGGVGDDTFVHVIKRRDERSTQLARLPSTVPEEQDEEALEEAQEAEQVQRQNSPFVPPRNLAPVAGSPAVEAEETRLEMAEVDEPLFTYPGDSPSPPSSPVNHEEVVTNDDRADITDETEADITLEMEADITQEMEVTNWEDSTAEISASEITGTSEMADSLVRQGSPAQLTKDEGSEEEADAEDEGNLTLDASKGEWDTSGEIVPAIEAFDIALREPSTEDAAEVEVTGEESINGDGRGDVTVEGDVDEWDESNEIVEPQVEADRLDDGPVSPARVITDSADGFDFESPIPQEPVHTLQGTETETNETVESQVEAGHAQRRRESRSAFVTVQRLLDDITAFASDDDCDALAPIAEIEPEPETKKLPANSTSTLLPPPDVTARRSPSPSSHALVPVPVLSASTRSTTPLFSPPPALRYERATSTPRAPLVLIQHKGDVTFAPTPMFSLLPLPHRDERALTPVSPAKASSAGLAEQRTKVEDEDASDEEDDAILRKSNRALRRLSTTPAPVRSQSPAVTSILHESAFASVQLVKDDSELCLTSQEAEREATPSTDLLQERPSDEIDKQDKHERDLDTPEVNVKASIPDLAVHSPRREDGAPSLPVPTSVIEETSKQEAAEEQTSASEENDLGEDRDDRSGGDTSSQVGDVTVEAEGSAWDLSTDDIAEPILDESEGSEHEAEEGATSGIVGAPEPVVSGTAGHRQPRPSSEEQPDQVEEEEEETRSNAASEEDIDSEEEAEADADAEAEAGYEHEHISPPPAEVPERIILRLVETGLIKLEPESDVEDEEAAEPIHGSNDIVEHEELTQPDPGARLSPSPSPRNTLLSPLPVRSPAVSGRDKIASPAPAINSLSRTPVTPPIYPSLRSTTPAGSPQKPASTTPASQPPVLRYPAPTSSSLSTLDKDLPNRVRRMSKLSKEILPSSSPAESTTNSPVHSSYSKDVRADNDSERLNDEGDESVIVRKARRSLHDELVAAADDEGDQAGDESFRSVVEVSSLDPKAAARAAAILKLNHAYIEHGILARDKHDNSMNISTGMGKSTSSHSDLEKRELLHEAELEIVDSYRRSRSRSVSRPPRIPATATGTAARARSMSVMSFMTEDYPVPGGYVKTPQARSTPTTATLALSKRKRPISPLPPMRERGSDSGVARDHDRAQDRWGVQEWKRLEKVYRTEREEWIKERDVKSLPSSSSPMPYMPGGLVAWARRSTLGKSTVEPREWDVERVVNRFLDGEKGQDWDRDMLVLRVQAIERRVNQIREKQMASSTATATKDFSTPAQKKPRREGSRPGDKSTATATATTTILETPFGSSAQKTAAAAMEPPSTIRRVLGFVWGKRTAANTKSETKGKGNGQGNGKGNGLMDRFEQANRADGAKGKGKEKEQEVLPTNDMREIRQSTATATGIVPRRPDVGQSAPAPPKSKPTSTLPIIRAPFVTSSTSLPDLRPLAPAAAPVPHFTSSVISASTSLARGDRLYPPLEPPITQRSRAIAQLFAPAPGPSSSSSTQMSMSTSTSAPNLTRSQKDGSVKNLVKSWEGKGEWA